MTAEFISINPDNPQEARIEQVVEVLREGGLVIYPTDTVYGLGCDLYNMKAIQKICHIRRLDPKKLSLSFICYDLSDISIYAKHVSNTAFKAMKKALPGPYTFILESSSQVPKILQVKKKQVGIRVPNHNIPRMLVKALGNPIISASIKDPDELVEYTTDPSLIYDLFKHHVDMVIDGGFGNNIPSTIIDCTTEPFEVVRHGLGEVDGII